MWYILAGILGGIIGGMGMGAGTLLVPILTLFLDIGQKEAQLMNIIAFVPMAIVTLIMNSKAKLIKWKYILYVGISGTITAILSSLLVGVIEGDILKRCFGVFLLCLATYFIISTIVNVIKKKKNETLTSINVVHEDEKDIR